MDYISFGSQGGFTGGSSTKYFYKDGKVVTRIKYMYNSPEIEIEQTEIDKNEIDEIFSLFTTDILKTKLVNPSNMSNIIEYKKGSDKYEWTYQISNPPEFLQEIHSKLETM